MITSVNLSVLLSATVVLLNISIKNIRSSYQSITLYVIPYICFWYKLSQSIKAILNCSNCVQCQDISYIFLGISLWYSGNHIVHGTTNLISCRHTNLETRYKSQGWIYRGKRRPINETRRSLLIRIYFVHQLAWLASVKSYTINLSNKETLFAIVLVLHIV